jgi:hypothetical protein
VSPSWSESPTRATTSCVTTTRRSVLLWPQSC